MEEKAGNQHRGEGLFLFPCPFGGCAESVRIEAGKKGKQLGKDKEGRAGGISRDQRRARYLEGGKQWWWC